MMASPRHLNAATRHLIWWLLLGLTVMSPAIYLPWHLPTRRAVVVPETKVVAVRAAVAHDTANVRPSPVGLTFDGWTVPLNKSHVEVDAGRWPRLILRTWAVVSSLQLVRLMVAFLLLKRRKSRAVPGPEWLTQRVQRWSGRKLGWVGVSDGIAMPIAVGLWHSAILIPAAMMGELSDADLEQIGMHEASHLARFDDYWILLQRVIEAVFVFHPAVRFIGRRIELEREIACDDFVIAAHRSRSDYAMFLTRIAESASGRGSVVASAVVDGRSNLAKRVGVLLDGTRHVGTRVLMGRFVIACAVIVLVALCCARNSAVIAFAQSLPVRLAQVQGPASPQATKQMGAQVKTEPDAKHAAGSMYADGAAWAEIPSFDVAGKRARLSGYIKTEGVTEGFAGLRWNVRDDADELIASADTAEAGAQGTAGWRHYEVEIPIPANGKRISFGVGLTGKGRAWFDSLAIELDGKAYDGGDFFDLDFESPQIGFSRGGTGYGVEVVDAVSHTGRRSLEIEYGGTTPRSSFAVATAGFPVEVAAGKHVAFSGYIKTEAVRHGQARLWWRVDDRERNPLAFRNLGDYVATGTSNWTRYEIDVPVSAEATNINFGASLDGEGTAWFDSFEIELDGVKYPGGPVFDFDFESDYPKGFGYTGGLNYGVQLDRSVFHTGKQSLRMKYGAEPVKYDQQDKWLPPGGAMATFPVSEVTGKRVKFSAYMKTRDVTDYASLFWTSRGDYRMLSNELLSERPSGTTDWKRYEFVIGIPRETKQIEIGAFIRGSGTVWVDSMELELDGVPYRQNLPGLDLDFEEEFVFNGFRAFGDGYWIGADRDVFHTGKQSLRIEKTP